MRLGMMLTQGRPLDVIASDVVAMEAAGVDSVTLGEAYTFDAVSLLGYLASRTSRIELATGILPLYSRTPALLAMTAAGLDFVSGGRFRLGLGSSGPQVVEGFHGVRFDAPLARTREIVEICRQVWRREPLDHHGPRYDIPLAAADGSVGRPLKIINHPVRDRIPVSIAGIGPGNAALAAEVADAWEPIFFHPELAKTVWGAALADGAIRRSAELDPLEIIVRTPLAFGDDMHALEQPVRAQLALYLGGMGSQGRNFYRDLAARYGFADQADEVQEHFLAGRRDEAAAAVPQDLVDACSLVGPEEIITDRLARLRQAGVGLLNVSPQAATADQRLADVSRLRRLI